MVPVAVLRLSPLEQRLQGIPSIRRRAHTPQGFQPFLGATDFEDVHPSGGTLGERAFQETGTEQQVERAGDLLELVADVGGELLTGEDDTRMPREEEQQVEVARVPQTGCFNELDSHLVGRLKLAVDAASPWRKGQRPPGREQPERQYSHLTGPAQRFDTPSASTHGSTGRMTLRRSPHTSLFPSMSWGSEASPTSLSPATCEV